MTPLIPAIGDSLVVSGLIGVVVGLHKVPPSARRMPRRGSMRRLALSRRTKLLLLAGLVSGLILAVLSGWLLAVVVVPVAAAGLPTLLSAGPARDNITKLEAMEEWTRSLAGVLVAGAGIEQSLVATLRSTPKAIRPEVGRLVARIRARWTTEDALRSFADDVDDATGDLIASNLILGTRRRGPGLAVVLDSLAESVAEDVRARRQIEADRAKPRTTARWVTIITVVVLVVFALTGSYVAPYRTTVGQLLLALLLSAYVGVLVWMRRMSRGVPLPRFIGSEAGGQPTR